MLDPSEHPRDVEDRVARAIFLKDGAPARIWDEIARPGSFLDKQKDDARKAARAAIRELFGRR